MRKLIERLRAEQGLTLVELMMAVSIMGIAFVSILGAMAVSIIASERHRDQSTANHILVSSAESLKSEAHNPFVACASASNYDTAAGITIPAGWSAPTIVSIRYWDGDDFVPACSSPNTVQLIALTLSSPDADTTEALAVVKRSQS